jgi:hypothetical protein
MMKLAIALLAASLAGGCYVEECQDSSGTTTNCIRWGDDTPDTERVESYQARSIGRAGEGFVALVHYSDSEDFEADHDVLATIDRDGALVSKVSLGSTASGMRVAGDGASSAALFSLQEQALFFLADGRSVRHEKLDVSADVIFDDGGYWVAIAGGSRELRRYALDGRRTKTIPLGDARFAIGPSLAIDPLHSGEVAMSNQVLGDEMVHVVVDRVRDGVVETIELARVVSPGLQIRPWTSRVALRDGAIAMTIGTHGGAGDLVIRARDGAITRTPLAVTCEQLVGTPTGYLATCGTQFQIFDERGTLVRTVAGAEDAKLAATTNGALAIDNVDNLSVATRVFGPTSERLTIIFRGSRDDS